MRIQIAWGNAKVGGESNMIAEVFKGIVCVRFSYNLGNSTVTEKT